MFEASVFMALPLLNFVAIYLLFLLNFIPIYMFIMGYILTIPIMYFTYNLAKKLRVYLASKYSSIFLLVFDLLNHGTIDKITASKSFHIPKNKFTSGEHPAALSSIAYLQLKATLML
jgi:hypothetical protein